MSDVKYANGTEIQLELFDAQLKFKLQNKEEVEDSTTIILSPQHLKVLSMMLVNAVRNYEEQFGEITLPEEVYQKKA